MILRSSEWRVSKGEYPSRIILHMDTPREYITHIEVAPPALAKGIALQPYRVAGGYFSNMHDADKDFDRRLIDHRLGRARYEI